MTRASQPAEGGLPCCSLIRGDVAEELRVGAPGSAINSRLAEPEPGPRLELAWAHLPQPEHMAGAFCATHFSQEINTHCAWLAHTHTHTQPRVYINSLFTT